VRDVAFLRAVCALLRDRLRDPAITAAALQAGLLPPEALALLTRALVGAAPSAPRELADEIQLSATLAARVLGMTPEQAAAAAPGAGAAAAAAVAPSAGSHEVFSKEIEDEANQQFQDLFNGGITVEELVSKLKTYMTSPDGRHVSLSWWSLSLFRSRSLCCEMMSQPYMLDC
jgi:hypothetical protein